MRSLAPSFRKFPQIFCASLLTVLGTLAAGPTQGQPPIKKPFDPENEGTTFRLFEQIDAAADQIAESRDDPEVVEYGLGEDHEPWMDLFQVTREDNPVITEGCRREALERTIEVTGDKELVRGHFGERMHAWNEVRQGTEKKKLSEYLHHLRKCKRACGPYVAELLDCHVQGVQSHSHMIVYFDVGRPRQHEEFSFAFSVHDERKLREFADRVVAEGRSLLLLSRASILHAGESILGNQVVANRRAQVVEDFLVRNGYPRSRIRKKVLSWEPPRLEAYEIAQAYGLEADWAALSNHQYMDQSTVLVAY